jgi:Hemerythrin HHE cation binding domain
MTEQLIIEESKHEALEEMYFWPVVRDHLPDGDTLADQATGQEQEAKEVLAKLDKLDPGDAEFETLLATFAAAAQEHIAFEESAVWPGLRTALNTERAAELGTQIADGKKTAPTRPHPHTPPSPGALKAAGPIAAVADRARDAVTGRGDGQVGYRVLGIYLNDHLAGATAGTELAHRVARTHRGPGPDGQLKRLAAEVAQDRAALIAMMKALGIPVRAYKVCAAWVGEKAGRVKFNGRLLARSPLSDLEELELLRLGVEGKAAGWRTLRTLADTDRRLDPAHLDELMSRARRQADLLEELRVRAAEQVISS